MAHREPDQIAMAELIGARVREYRKARGLSQERLARRMDVAFQTVNLIENARHVPTLMTLQKLASALGVDITDLFRPTNTQVSDATADEATNSYLQYLVLYQRLPIGEALAICRNRTRSTPAVTYLRAVGEGR